MPVASRVILTPPEAWDDAKLAEAALTVAPPGEPLRPGDDVGGLVVTRVEPETGLAPDANTVFEVEPHPRPTTGPLHVAALIDCSASMSVPWSVRRTRLDAARDALLAYLKGGAKSAHRVSVLAFARDPSVVAGPLDPAHAPTSLALPSAEGPARTGRAIDAALAHLAAQSGGARAAIALLSDSPGDESALLAAAERARRLRIPIHVLVLAPEIDDLYEEIARTTRGSIRQARDPPVLEELS